MMGAAVGAEEVGPRAGTPTTGQSSGPGRGVRSRTSKSTASAASKCGRNGLGSIPTYTPHPIQPALGPVPRSAQMQTPCPPRGAFARHHTFNRAIPSSIDGLPSLPVWKPASSSSFPDESAAAAWAALSELARSRAAAPALASRLVAMSELTVDFQRRREFLWAGGGQVSRASARGGRNGGERTSCLGDRSTGRARLTARGR